MHLLLAPGPCLAPVKQVVRPICPVPLDSQEKGSPDGASDSNLAPPWANIVAHTLQTFCACAVCDGPPTLRGVPMHLAKQVTFGHSSVSAHETPGARSGQRENDGLRVLNPSWAAAEAGERLHANGYESVRSRCLEATARDKHRMHRVFGNASMSASANASVDDVDAGDGDMAEDSSSERHWPIRVGCNQPVGGP